MDRQWMYGQRCTMTWINGLKTFLDAVVTHKPSKGFMFCPCRICIKEFSRIHTLHVHLFEKGFMDNYTLWTKHGEPGVLMEDNEEDNDDDNIPDWAHLYEAVDAEINTLESEGKCSPSTESRPSVSI